MKWLIVMGLILTGCVVPRGFPPNGGIQNFDRVDSLLFRGAQPNVLGLESLAGRGIQTVINLRDDELPFEPFETVRLGLTYYHVPMWGVMAPKTETVNAILATIEKSAKPVFVHCQYGCERTGLIVACYRIRNGWTTQGALKEAKGYGLSTWAVEMKEFILQFK